MISYTDAAAFIVTLASNLMLIGFPVALSVAAAFRLTRLASPRARYIVAVTAFFVVSLLPVTATLRTAHGPEETLTTAAAVAKSIDGIKDGVSEVNVAPAQSPGAAESVRTKSPGLGSVIDNFIRVIANSPLAVAFLGLWVLITILLLGRELAGYVQLVRARRRWKPADEALRDELAWPDAVPLYIDECEGPFAFGLLRPAVVLPARLLMELTSEELRSIARHELAHVKWHDPLVNGLLRSVRALLWPSLPLWYLERAARFEREAAADRAAISATYSLTSAGISATNYVSALISVAKWSDSISRKQRHTLIATEVGGRSNLEDRVRRLLPTAAKLSTVHLSLACLILSASILGVFVLPVASQPNRLAPSIAPNNRDSHSHEDKAAQLISSPIVERDVWLIIKEGGRRLEIANGYSISMNGGGKVNFKDEGRVIELPEGLTILVNEKPVSAERKVHEGELVRIINAAEETVWKLAAIPATDAPRLNRPRSRRGLKNRMP
jgi:beta-lactamase regulating signal transducer with metallopeptidase domain